MGIFRDMKDFIKDTNKKHKDKYSNGFKQEVKIMELTKEDIIKMFNILRNNQVNIFKCLMELKYKQGTNKNGVVLKDKLPWNVSSKEVYMLSKHYSLEEIEFITGYDKAEIQKKIAEHAKRNL